MKAGRRAVGIPLNLTWDQLRSNVSAGKDIMFGWSQGASWQRDKRNVGIGREEHTHVSRYKNAQGTGFGEETMLVDRHDNSIDLSCQQVVTLAKQSRICAHRLALEGPPDYGTVTDREFRKSTARQDATLRNGEAVHHGDDIVAAGTCPFDVLHQFGGNELCHVLAEVGGMKRQATLEIIEEKHDDSKVNDVGAGWSRVVVSSRRRER